MERPSKKQLEQKEAVTAGTLNGEELFDLIYQGDSYPADKRFLDDKRGGVFKYFDLPKLVQRRKKLVYPNVMVNGKIVGLAELEQSPYEVGVWWISFLSVDPNFQGNQYASKVVEEIFRYAKEQGLIIQGSKYTADGRLKLKNKLGEVAGRLGVEFRDADERDSMS